MSFLVIVRAHLGTGPWHVVNQGLAEHLGTGLGTSMWITGLAFLVAAMAAGERPGPATLAAAFLGGIYVNVAAPYVGDLHGAFARVAGLLGATVAMTFGGALYMSAALGASPLDALMTGLYRRSPLSIRAVRIGLEVLGLALGWMLGGEVGVGTVLIGITVGPLLQMWLRVLRATPEKRLVELQP